MRVANNIDITIAQGGIDTCKIVLDKLGRGQDVDGARLSQIIHSIAPLFVDDASHQNFIFSVRAWISLNMNGVWTMVFPYVDTI